MVKGGAVVGFGAVQAGGAGEGQLELRCWQHGRVPAQVRESGTARHFRA